MRAFLGSLVLSGLFLATACNGGVGNDGDLVGGPCDHDRECVEECLGGKDFPDGTCSVACKDDYDCPGGTVCIDKQGGVCLLTCEVDSDCRGGYSCRDEDRKGAGGKAGVCID